MYLLSNWIEKNADYSDMKHAKEVNLYTDDDIIKKNHVSTFGSFPY
jgi:hypothetical protein